MSPTHSHGDASHSLPSLDLQLSDEGINLVAFLHSIRRRWLTPSVPNILAWLGLLAVVAVVAVLMWKFIPEDVQATALIQVGRVDPRIVERRQYSTSDLRSFEGFKATQVDLLKSAYVLESALRPASVSQMPLVRKEGQDNPVAWLQRELKVGSTQDSEILRVSMWGDDEDQIKKLVDAVVDAYLEEVVLKTRERKSHRLDVLKESYRKNITDLKRQAEIIKSLQQTLKAVDNEQVQILLKLALQDLGVLNRQRIETEEKLAEADSQIQYLRTQLQLRNKNPNPFDSYEIEDALLQDPQYAAAYEMVRGLDEQFQLASTTAKPGAKSLARRMEELQGAQAKMDRLREELTPRCMARLRRQYGYNENVEYETLQLLEVQRNALAKRLADVTKKYESQQDFVRGMGGDSADLDSKQAELDSLRATTNDTKSQIDMLTLDLQAPDRIRKWQSATVPDEPNWWVKWAEMIAVSLFLIGSTVLGVAFWDYQGKRVNVAADVPKGTGIHVIGSLPLLRADWPASLWARQRDRDGILNDSIDSIRTALLFTKSGAPIRVVMITSASGQEGKTTVASQLAVSLARSGRRTLLIDADLRNPQQHLLFGMPPDIGLAELLRGEAAVEDVIQEAPFGPSGNLCIVQAGYSDPSSIQALSGKRMREILDHLKSSSDSESNSEFAFEYIVLDSGPVLTGAESLLLGQHVDATILSARRDVSQTPKLFQACDRLQSVGVRVMGVVVNGAGTEVRRTRTARLAIAESTPAERDYLSTDEAPAGDQSA